MSNKQDIKVEIHIGRDSLGGFHIDIRDETSREQIVKVTMTAEEFAFAITGMWSSDIKAEVGKHLDRVGKEKVVQTREAFYAGPRDSEEIRKWMLENLQEPGWIIDTYIGSKKSIVPNGDHYIINYRVYKFV